MAWYKRREISMFLTSAIIILFLVDFNLNIPELKPLTNNLTSWGTVIAAFAIGLGFINLFQNYGKKVQKQTAGWPYALILLITTIGVSLVGIWQGLTGPISSYIYNNVVAPLDATFYSIAVFYMASASYRAFKFKSIESSTLLICAFIVLLKNAPVGETIWTGFQPLGTWLMNYPVTGVSRGVTITTAFGSVALALRVLIGKESSYLAGTQEKEA
jgi:hypothetical protein